MADQLRTIHTCRCLDCLRFPSSNIAQDHQAINRVLANLNEKGRRLFAGLLASERGRGGVAHLATITGMSRNTIRRGMLEVRRADSDTNHRVRRPGGGRQRLEKKSPAC
jgi:DNA-binding phage protein